MAFSTTRKETYYKKGLLKNVITLLDTAGNSQAMDLADAINITMQVEGTFSAATVKIQVSNDGATFYDTSIATARAAAGVIAVAEIDRGYSQYRLNMAGGAAGTTLTCTLISRIRQAGTP